MLKSDLLNRMDRSLTRWIHLHYDSIKWCQTFWHWRNMNSVSLPLTNLRALKSLQHRYFEEQLIVRILLYLEAALHVKLTSLYPHCYAAPRNRLYTIPFLLKSFQIRANQFSSLRGSKIHHLLLCLSSLLEDVDLPPDAFAIRLAVSLKHSIIAPEAKWYACNPSCLSRA